MILDYFDHNFIDEFVANYNKSSWFYRKNIFDPDMLCNWSELNYTISILDSYNDVLMLGESGFVSPYNLFKDKKKRAQEISNVFNKYIFNGYTFVLNSAHTKHVKLAKFCSNLSQFLCTNTQANLYASWKNSRSPFGSHWDEQDTFIIQLEGSKKWKIYDFADLDPVNHKHIVKKSEKLLAEFTLQKGDVLYVPMGQIHSAETGDDISLHATIGIHRYTALDLLDWLKDDLSKIPEFRKRMPNINDKKQMEEFVSNFFSNLSKVQWSSNKIHNVMHHLKSNFKFNSLLNLPYVGIESADANFANQTFILNHFIRYEKEHQNGLIITNGLKKWVVPKEISASFNELLLGKPVHYSTLSREGFENGMQINYINKVCTDMIHAGIITIYN
ncbi:JmjC domain-containing protein [Acinetobacter sp. PFS20]|uniref:JmjC domain-containing protein n=1 Tax=Acinetobacter sp. PFS20 TaxID=3458434 RepID=UPI0033402B89